MDHMVLDRANATLWGVGAKPGTKVMITLNDTSLFADNPPLSTVVGSDGLWSVSLGAQPAGTGSTIRFSGSDGSEARLEDVAFGDVLLCAGQVSISLPSPALLRLMLSSKLVLRFRATWSTL